MKLTVEAMPRQVWVGDPVTVELRVETPDDYVVQFPAEDALGEVDVRGVETADPRPGPEGGLIWQQTFMFESLVSGVVEIPALEVKYAHKPADADAKPVFEHTLVAEPLPIEVRSALTTQDSLLKPRDITGTLPLPRQPRSPWFWAALVGGALIGLAGVAGVVMWLRRLAKRLPPPILPEVWALRALAELVAADLITAGRIKAFYYRLSEIVRVYIERKFALAAPEMTTEEFLVALARDRGALPYDADRLRNFLQACDLVKYAAFRPREEDVDAVMRTARAFIDATAAAAQDGRATTAAPREEGGQAA